MLKALFFDPLRRIPGPFLYRLSGLPWLWQSIRGKGFQHALELHDKFGSVVCVAPGVVLVADKEAVRKVLVSADFPKSKMYIKFRQEVHRPTLFSATEKPWHKSRRRLLSTAFSLSYVKSLEPLVQGCILELVCKFQKDCLSNNGTATVDIYKTLNMLALDIIGEIAFGGTFNIVANGSHPLPEKLTSSLRMTAMQQIFPPLKYIPFIPSARDEWIDKFMQQIIDKRKSSVEHHRPDILQVLINTQNGEDSLSDLDIQDEIIVFLMAGSETTSNSIAFAIMFLLQNPEAMRQLKIEIESTFPTKDSVPTHSATKELPYLNAVIHETMRLMPPAADEGFSREAPSDVAFGDYYVPQETTIICSTTHLHYNSHYWANPRAFVPGRWLPGGTEPTWDAYYPFSAGTRNCIGKNFALMESRLVLARLIHMFEFELIPGQDTELVHLVTLQLKANQYLVKIKEKFSPGM
ncbi:cytochrome P450 [Basidiobolus meristosporus CBS 931.73]|uniref:Cytochrome P450 n=1 Tax=Basidiobolus meristosporus CBS 931.73 TaxID=1314790 RepID=A0A1Y1XM91_9FUNG|nr:cytochrome P450 [Basidiobolus meristosporus CBS 931.73]|eukprot:ORX86869.1 cytochrome P450 [Basidiobolus meristosporus CBS 931.73]